MKQRQTSLDDLHKGIEQLLEKNRYPLSPEDHDLLVECNDELLRLKDLDSEVKSLSLQDTVTITTLLLKFLDLFKDIL
jgi:hypothetical protein